MPTIVKILSWNIQDVGAGQINDADFIDLVKEVIVHEAADLVSILETKSDLGDTFGKKLVAKLGAGWAYDSSPKSAPHGNKPENYVFVWKIAKLTLTTAYIPDEKKHKKYVDLKFPHKHNNRREQSPSRFPYIGKFEVDPTQRHPLTVVSFHTCYSAAWTPEANQNLAKIEDVGTDTNVIVMGDFNDHPSYGHSYRGVGSFHKLETAAPIGHGCAHQIDEETSLVTDFVKGWTLTTEPRSKRYDNFFVKLAGTHAIQSSKVVDLLADLIHPNYLTSVGKKVFNGWVARKTAEYTKKGETFNIEEFGATDNIEDCEDAHEVYKLSISDHLPVLLEVQFA